MASVELLLSPMPAHVRTARLVAVAAARRAGLDGVALDEVRLAVGEACARAVALHTRHALDVPVRVTLDADPTGLAVAVADAGPAAAPPSQDSDLSDSAGDPAVFDDDVVDPDVSLAVLIGLFDDVRVESAETGTTVTLRWPLPPGSGPRSTVLA